MHAGPLDATVISCGDIKTKTPKATSNAWLKGANHEHGHVELVQKGGDISGWIKVGASRLARTPCRSTRARVPRPAPWPTLGDVTADADGNAFAKLAATTAAVVGKDFTIDVSAGASATPGAVVACGDQHPTGWKHGHHK